MADQREATLDELLNEPIILTVMASDGVRGADIRRLMQRVRAREERNAPAICARSRSPACTCFPGSLPHRSRPDEAADLPRLDLRLQRLDMRLGDRGRRPLDGAEAADDGEPDRGELRAAALLAAGLRGDHRLAEDAGSSPRPGPRRACRTSPCAAPPPRSSRRRRSARAARSCRGRCGLPGRD